MSGSPFETTGGLSCSGVGRIGFSAFGSRDYPNDSYVCNDLDAAGEIVMNSRFVSNERVDDGTLLHAIGRTLGLKHPIQLTTDCPDLADDGMEALSKGTGRIF